MPGRGAVDEAFCQDGVRRTRLLPGRGEEDEAFCQDGVRRTRRLPGRGEEDEALARTWGGRKPARPAIPRQDPLEIIIVENG